MKKVLIISGMALVLSMAFASPSLYAGSAKKSKDAISKVVAAFSLEFPNAREVKWDMSQGFCNVNFTLENERIRMQYNRMGHLMFTYLYRHDTSLPLGISMKLSKEYSSFAIKNVVEYSSGKTHLYFVMIKDKKQWIRLEFKSDSGKPIVYEKFTEPS